MAATSTRSVGGEAGIGTAAILTDDVAACGKLQGVYGGSVEDAGPLEFVAFAGDVAIKQDEAGEVLELVELVG